MKFTRSVFRLKSYFWISHWKHVYKGYRETTGVSTCNTIHGSIKKKYLMNAFFNSQVSYCPLVWMCHSLALNNKMNRLNKHRLRLIYNAKQLTFEELLKKDDSVSIYIRNLQTFTIEMSWMVFLLKLWRIFRILEGNGYILRHQNIFKRPIVNSVYNGTEKV